MAARVHVTGPQHWAAQGVAQVLAQAGGAAWRVDALAPDDALAARDTDVLVAVRADPPLAQRIESGLPRSAAVLWLGSTAPAGTARAQGQLAADADDARLAGAVHALAAGLHVRDTGWPASATAAPAVPLDEPLTPREVEVFELLAKGLANREIAQVLGITAHTAKFHVARILEKTGAATRTEAVRQGLRLGVIGL